MSLIRSLGMIAEGSMFEVAQLAVQPEDKSCPAHLQMHSSWQSRRVGDTRKIEGESVGRFVDVRGQTHSWIHHTPEAQDPAACGTALAAMPAPAGGSCFRHAFVTISFQAFVMHNSIMSFRFISHIFWPKRISCLKCRFPSFYHIDFLMKSQETGRQILRADVAAVGSSMSESRNDDPWESEICKCIIAWHLNLKCIMQCNAALIVYDYTYYF